MYACVYRGWEGVWVSDFFFTKCRVLLVTLTIIFLAILNNNKKIKTKQKKN